MYKVAARGFTLVELVVVITILGILAAFAVPRFLALDTQARVAAVQGLAGSVRSATSLTHSLFLANGGGAITMDGAAAPITMTNGYPAASAAGIWATLQDTSGFSNTAGNPFLMSSASASGTCQVSYTAATVAVPPVIVVDTSGC